MTKIRLLHITLRNFKGTQSLALNFEGRNSVISGANGSGKTTVYKAYYWCLTGKTLEPNEIVQMLDANNEVIHKIETSVSMTLRIDNSYDVILERRLVEDWRALGQPDEQLKGTKQLRFWNDVPLSVAEFNAKLSNICNLDYWLMLSDITKFMSLKTEERRKILLSAAGEINEEDIVKRYPEIEKAIKEKKSVEELKIQTLSTKKRSHDELKTIPSQIKAQDALKVNEDFDALRKELLETDAKIADLDKLLLGSAEDLQSMKAYLEKEAKAESDLQKYKAEWNKAQPKKISEALKQKTETENALAELEKDIKGKEEENNTRIEKRTKLKEEFLSVREKWEKENSKEFSFDTSDCCPICGHRFSDIEKEEQKIKAIAEFNKIKAANLEGLQKEAEALNARIVVLTGSINEYNKIIQPQDKNALDARKTAKKAAFDNYVAISQASIEEDLTYIALKQSLASIQETKPVVHQNTDRSQERELLRKKHDEIVKKLAGEQTNQRIEEEKQNLTERSKQLAQIIADCDKVLWEINGYRKAKVDALEGKVNAFFSLAQWKFYEKNVSNDDLQEVCVCYHNGVDYNSTNCANRINMGIDIVAGLSKALQIEAPIWVDSAESVNTLLQTENQQIALRVTTSKFTTELL